MAFVDGFTIKDSRVPHQGLVGGDGRSAAVAAASIVAKVVRDRLMVTMHELWPSWGFDENVGYATPGHHAAILEHGLADLHRRSFQSVAYQQLELGFVPLAEVEERYAEESAEGFAAEGFAAEQGPVVEEGFAAEEALAPEERPFAGLVGPSEAPSPSEAPVS